MRGFILGCHAPNPELMSAAAESERLIPQQSPGFSIHMRQKNAKVSQRIHKILNFARAAGGAVLQFARSLLNGISRFFNFRQRLVSVVLHHCQEVRVVPGRFCSP